MPGTVGVARGGGIPCEPGGGVGSARGGPGVSVAVRGGNGPVCEGGAPPMHALPVAPALRTPRAIRVQFISASCSSVIRHSSAQAAAAVPHPWRWDSAGGPLGKTAAASPHRLGERSPGCYHRKQQSANRLPASLWDPKLPSRLSHRGIIAGVTSGSWGLPLDDFSVHEALEASGTTTAALNGTRCVPGEFPFTKRTVRPPTAE